jgi:hypothetical protein
VSLNIIFLYFFFAALMNSVHGQANRRIVDTEPKYLATQAGLSVNLMCRIAVPITTCKFIIPGEPAEVKLNPSWTRTDNFRYFGNGLENGNCGVTIVSVRDEHYGNATCHLDPNDGGLDAIGTIEIVIARAPQPPQILFPNQDPRIFEADKEIEAECAVVDGRPAANITWFLNDQPLGPGASEIVDSNNEGTTYYTTYSKLRRRLRPDDHTKALICRAYHAGYQDGFQDTRMQLNVNFRPVPLPESFVQGLEIGSSAVIGPITIQANPRPTLKWTVDGTVINQGEQTQRFVANEPVQSGIGLWNVSLTVIELTLQDTTRSYRLRANNAFGTTDYTIRIGSQDVTGSFKLRMCKQNSI